jgi:hypothetical protein
MARDPRSDLDSRLAGARADVHAALAAEARAGMPWTKIIPVLAALLVAAALGWTALLVLRPARRDGIPARIEPAVAVERSQLLPPLDVRAEGDELTAPFDGFAVSIETEPAGGIVTVAGVARGEAPVLAGVACVPGQPVEIVAALPGRAPLRRTTTCRPDTLVKLTLSPGP